MDTKITWGLDFTCAWEDVWQDSDQKSTRNDNDQNLGHAVGLSAKGRVYNFWSSVGHWRMSEYKKEMLLYISLW